LRAAPFDYEKKVWGVSPVVAKPWALQGLKLRYCLEDLVHVTGVIADVGCGGGNMARAIKRERGDLEVIGVDVSQAAISAARRQGDDLTFHNADASRLPFRDSTLDAATMFDVLEHLADPGAALAEVARVLKPGGLFHIAQPLEDQPGTLHRFLRRRGWRAKVRHSGHIQAFDEPAFRRLAAGAGLEVLRVRYSAHHLMTLADVAYYCWLDLRESAGHPRESLDAPGGGPAGAVSRAGAALKSVVATVGWYESRLFASVPGTCGHFTLSSQA
jgi:SAM-dependent methyltransferase